MRSNKYEGLVHEEKRGGPSARVGDRSFRPGIRPGEARILGRIPEPGSNVNSIVEGEV